MGDGSTYYLTRWLFLRLLGFIYLLAFASFLTQTDGLIGQHGICPAGEMLAEAAKSDGIGCYWQVPTLAWFDSSNAFLEFLSKGGVVLTLLLILGIGTTPALVLLWVFWLSIVSVGDVFSGFQSDGLLLETGFLAIFLAPAQLLAPPWPGPPWATRDPGPSKVVLWLLRWEVFRLIFGSGLAKLLSGDPYWRDLTALTYHYETQPLPTPAGWYAHHLPLWFQKLSVIGTYVSEVVGPLLMFGQRKYRLLSAALIAFLQVLIELTGNYTFLNLLALTLCVPLLDDHFLRRLFPKRLADKIVDSGQRSAPFRFERFWLVPLAAVVIVVSTAQMTTMLFGGQPPPRFVRAALAFLSPFRTINAYGVFGIMTTERFELVVEGSQDKKTWSEYEFQYEPGPLNRPPPWVAPLQPRLDWRFWFAGMDREVNEQWVVNFVIRLLEGSPDVLALLGKNPFPDAPPRYIRIMRYQYLINDIQTLKATGQWWRREFHGEYMSPFQSQTRR